MSEAYKGQKYGSIKKNLQKKGELFVDSEFPAGSKSLFFSKQIPGVEWKRPKEICKVPKFVIDGVTCDDLHEGDFGNPWFVTACSSLSQETKLWQKVVPDAKDQEWNQTNTYCGIFHFQFWRFGRWIDVVVDDLLPTKDNKLIFCHSKNRNEFWSALLEKAYAKLYGDYETLSNGDIADALIDLSGGLCERWRPENILSADEEEKERHFQEMKENMENKALIVCSIKGDKSKSGTSTDKGLISGHSYSITSIIDIKVNRSMKTVIKQDRLTLIRLSNPWNKNEWSGAWSDNSEQFSHLTQQDREELGITFMSEGEFWMDYNDLLANFTNIDICHFVNTAFFTIKKSWTEFMQGGEWSKGARGTKRDRAGGSADCVSFLFNPQYVFDVSGATDNLLISLEQNDTKGRESGSKNLCIGFHIMKVEDNRKFRVHLAGEKKKTSAYVTDRSIFDKITLSRGRYVIIPTTQKAQVVGEFLLRVYSRGDVNCRPLVKDCPKSSCCAKPYAMVTTLKLVGCEGLEKVKDNQTIDAYAVIRGEGDTVKSMWIRDNVNPAWGCKSVFYRKKVDQPIIVEIWNRNSMIDTFLGLAEITDHGEEEGSTKTQDLYGKGKKERDVKKPGKLKFEIASSNELTAL